MPPKNLLVEAKKPTKKNNNPTPTPNTTLKKPNHKKKKSTKKKKQQTPPQTPKKTNPKPKTNQASPCVYVEQLIQGLSRGSENGLKRVNLVHYDYKNQIQGRGKIRS